MNEETTGKGDTRIPLTPPEYQALERAMQWPEDLAAYDRLSKPINMAELFPDNSI